MTQGKDFYKLRSFCIKLQQLGNSTKIRHKSKVTVYIFADINIFYEMILK